ncbi:MAG: tetratricopeptide repeat protein, partial [Vibrio fluvialis]
LDGDMKKIFMDILNALGQSNSTASRYRRQLYSLLY